MKISFPRLADYHVPIARLIKNVLPHAEVMPAPPITAKTLELGARHSPDLVCSPFKYNLGNFFQALEQGADVLFQAGGGCRFGYYAELQEQILRDAGYTFTFINLFEGGRISPKKLLRIFRNLGSKISMTKLIYQLLLTIKIIKVMDRLDFFYRQNLGRQLQFGTLQALKIEFLEKLESVKSFVKLNKISKNFWQKYRAVPLSSPKKALKVGIVGELFNLMEENANRHIEQFLAKNGISVTRHTNVTYLLFEKWRLKRRHLSEAAGYLKYDLGADGTLSVAASRTFAEKGYDGIIHIKPFGCTPEVNAMPMLTRIARDYKIPILFFSFDTETSDTGVQTRLEAFVDMLRLKQK